MIIFQCDMTITDAVEFDSVEHSSVFYILSVLFSCFSFLAFLCILIIASFIIIILLCLYIFGNLSDGVRVVFYDFIVLVSFPEVFSGRYFLLY